MFRIQPREPTQSPLSPKQMFYHYTNREKKSLHLHFCDVLFMIRLRFCLGRSRNEEHTAVVHPPYSSRSRGTHYQLVTLVSRHLQSVHAASLYLMLLFSFVHTLLMNVGSSSSDQGELTPKVWEHLWRSVLLFSRCRNSQLTNCSLSELAFLSP